MKILIEGGVGMAQNISEMNREAWNEAMGYIEAARGEALEKGFQDKDFTVLNRLSDQRIMEKLKYYDFTGRNIAHIQCNDGRELLSLMKRGAAKAVGFDISDKAIEEAEKLAQIADLKASFIRTDILDITTGYNKLFDFVYISEGSLQWFPDLKAYFEVVSRMMKKGGRLVIYETHPFAYMAEHLAGNDDRIIDDFISYFDHGPFNYPEGLDNVGNVKYKAKECCWYNHQMSDIVGAILENNIRIRCFEEYKELADDHKAKAEISNLPMSYMIIGEKL